MESKPRDENQLGKHLASRPIQHNSDGTSSLKITSAIEPKDIVFESEPKREERMEPSKLLDLCLRYRLAIKAHEVEESYSDLVEFAHAHQQAMQAAQEEIARLRDQYKFAMDQWESLQNKHLKFHDSQWKLKAAEIVMQKLDDLVQRDLLDARSAVVDARQNYSDPLKYAEWEKSELGQLAQRTQGLEAENTLLLGENLRMTEKTQALEARVKELCDMANPIIEERNDLRKRADRLQGEVERANDVKIPCEHVAQDVAASRCLKCNYEVAKLGLRSLGQQLTELRAENERLKASQRNQK